MGLGVEDSESMRIWLYMLTMWNAQRDATQRESLSTTIRVLRADALRQTNEIERLTLKNAESARKLAIAESSERAAKLQLKSAEVAARGMKEEMARMKVLVGQTRAQCANEVRKRERVIEGLKKHVGEGGRARGSGKAVGVVTVNVVPGIGEKEVIGRGSGVGVREEGYDLRSETNEFLTELARGLSEENEVVSGLLRRTVDTLKSLSGCDKLEDQQVDGNGVVVNMDGTQDNLPHELEDVLNHLRTLLTNPSFVPLEEVEIREEEIIRLREGWERMETRWREAVQMMDGWRKRMARSGQTVNLEELKMGLLLSPLKSGEEERVGLSMIGEDDEDEGDTQADIDAMTDSEMMEEEYDEEPVEPGEFMEEEEDFEVEESSLFAEIPVDQPQEPDQDNVVVEQQAERSFGSLPSSSPGPPPQLSPLRETNGNASKVSYPDGPQKDSFTTIMEENTIDLLELASDSPSPIKSAKRAKSTPKNIEPTPSRGSRLAEIEQEEEIDLLQTSASSSRATTATASSRQREASPQKPTAASPVKAQSQPRSTIKPPQTLEPPQSTRFSSAKPSSSSSNPQQPLPPAATPSHPKLRSLELNPSSRLPRPNDAHHRPQQSPLTMATIAAKLAATEREADAARVRAKLKAARLGRIKSQTAGTTNTMPPPPTSTIRRVPIQDEDDERPDMKIDSAEEKGAEDGARKRKAGRTQGGRANRRRSALSPWEMESLILGGLGAGSPLKDS